MTGLRLMLSAKHSQPSLVVAVVAVTAIAVGGLAWLLASLGNGPAPLATSRVVPPSPIAPARVLFAPSSVWNRVVAPNVAADPASSAMVRALTLEVDREARTGIGPSIGTKGTGTLYVVGSTQPTGRVKLDAPRLSWRASLQAAFAAVPVPTDAQPSTGSDREMTVWQPSADKLWEFFHMRKEPDGWHAAWGGAIQNVSRSPGYYTPGSWFGARPIWGATATSLPAAAGVITLADIKQGHIDHALALNLPYPRAGVWTWPAQRSDGTGTDPYDIPEGAHLRLNPQLDLAALHLPRLVLMMARAAQRYGIIVRDQTHRAIGFSAEDTTTPGTDPYFANGVPRSHGPFQGRSPSALLRGFPWRELQVLKMSVCTMRDAAHAGRASVAGEATTPTRCGQP